jgi:lipoprotein-releasing system permease protein
VRSFFLFFILKAKNRQGLLNLVLLGLGLSSMSLIILQGIMGGLQSNLKQRSKAIVGDYVIYSNINSVREIKNLRAYLDHKEIVYRIENVHEGLAKFGPVVIPVILHGVYNTSDKVDVSDGAIFPYEVVSRLGASPGQDIEFYSPSYTDSFFGDMPRSFSLGIKNVVTTRVPEIDSSHIWLKSSKLNNFMRDVHANRIRIFSNQSKKEVHEHISKIIPVITMEDIKSWNELHTSLVWALNLEKTMMTFLFFGMCFLVCLTISSAVLVFIKKVNKDLTALWVLGSSKKDIFNTSRFSLILICILSILFGIILGGGVLFLLDNFAGNIMPDIFVERKIPVHYSVSMFLVSFLIPSFLSISFVHFGLNDFKNETDYLKNVRSIGQI